MNFVMKSLIAAAGLGLAAGPALGAETPAKPAEQPGTAAPAPAMSLDTPIEQIAANEQGRAILDKHLPGLTSHAMWEAFKAMSLNQLAPVVGGAIPASQLELVAADLAALQKN